MTMIKKSPLETLITKKIGVAEAHFTLDHLKRYQLHKLRETIKFARQNSLFYRNLLQGFSDRELDSLDDLQRFPFTDAQDIREHALRFLCVSQDDISRVVTLDSSGTTGNAKRIFFTAGDQELTVDYFQYGMASLTDKGDRILILFPGERPGSLGDLLAKALKRLDAEPVLHGVVRSIPATLDVIVQENIDCLVGIPTQALALARYAAHRNIPLRLKGALLSSDHVPYAIVRELERLWGCPVYDHYGMTEMGLGGGTECAARCGYHLHEADLYMEIVDPLTGEPLPEGQSGEIVVTTLTRQGMPLIRYRTGDISRFLTEPCACGTILRRLDKITVRKDNRVRLTDNQYFAMSDLDEALFAVDKVVDFTAAVDNVKKATQLTISAVMVEQCGEAAEAAIAKALDGITAIGQARRAGRLAVRIKTARCDDVLTPRAAKRAIVELKETNE